MKIGDYLIAKVDITKNIYSGDGMVDSFEIKKGEKFLISDVDIKRNSLEICYKNGRNLWFFIQTEDGLFFEHYKKYFYDCDKTNRKLKLSKLNELYKSTI